MLRKRRLAVALLSLMLFALAGATGYGLLRVLNATPQLPAAVAAVIPAAPPDTLHVLSYNVFLRPGAISSADYTEARAEQIGRWLAEANVDVVALQEAWEPRAIAALVEAVHHRLPYYVHNQPGKPANKLTSGGLLILSRWPIEHLRTLVFDECRLADCLAAKGAAHVVIRLSADVTLNFVTTHLDAGSTRQDYEARAGQIEQLRHFMAQIDPATGPTLIAGDFNVDALAGDGEVEMLLDALDLEPHGAPLISTVNCDLETNIFCETPVAPQHIDYIFTRRGESQLVHRETQILPLATDAIDDHVKYLSDHRAVSATFATAFDRLR